MKLAVLAVVVLAGCTDAVPLEPGCGNFVLEPGEDCDRPANCRDCRITCIEDEPTTCAEGSVCGPADSVCHAPGGTFTLVDTGSTLSALGFQIGRANDDGYGDVVGVASGSIATLYGDDDAPLASKDTVSAPFPTARGAIGRFTYDDDGALDRFVDVVIPSAAGLVTYENRDGVPATAVFPFVLDPQRQQLHVGAMPPSLVLPVGTTVRVTRRVDVPEVVVDVDFPSLLMEPAPKVPCGYQPHEDDVFVGRIHPFELAGGQIAVPLLVDRNDRNLPPALCVEVVTDSVVRAFEQFPAGTRAAGGEVFFANIGDVGTPDTCPDLAIPLFDVANQRPMTRLRYGEDPGTGCRLSTVVTDLAGVALAAVPRTGRSLLVTSAGVYDLSLSPTPILFATRAWTNAAVGDFDNDGVTDFAVASSGEDIEVYEARGSLQWRVLRVPQTGFFGGLVAGDFDGDGFDDLAYAAADLTLGVYHVLVTYGGASAFSEPAITTSFAALFDLAAAPLVDPSIAQSTDVYTDLVIAHGGLPPGADDPGRISYLYGSANRQLSAAWRPACLTRAHAVVLGRYGGGPGLLALFGKLDNANPGPSCTNAFDVTGLRRDPFTFAETLELDTSYIRDDDIENFVFETVPIGDRDLALGLRSVPSKLVEVEPTMAVPSTPACALHAWSNGTVADRSTCPELLGGSTFTPATRSLDRVFDIEAHVGRNQPTIVVLGDPLPSDNQDDIVMFEWSVGIAPAPPPSGGRPPRNEVPRLRDPIDLSAEIEKKAMPTALFFRCFEATFAELGTRGVYGDGKELVVACLIVDEETRTSQVRIYARYVHPDDRSDAVVELVGPGELSFLDLEAGDVTGDGLDDIVAVGAFGSVQVFVQCDIHGCPTEEAL